MSCVRCRGPDAPAKVSLTPNVHEALCTTCAEAWERHARKGLVTRNRHGAVLAAFRRWCAAKEAA